MPTLRDFVTILTRHLDTPVAAHAGCLARAGCLPRRDDQVSEYNAATLLPADAGRAGETRSWPWLWRSMKRTKPECA